MFSGIAGVVLTGVRAPEDITLVAQRLAALEVEADLLEVFQFRESTCVIYVLTMPAGS